MLKNTLFHLTLLLLIINTHTLVYATKTGSLGCRDEDNNLVDYFYLYKLPKSKDNEDGLSYLYLTSESVKTTKTWTKSGNKINQLSSIPGISLSVLYSNETLSKHIAILYNDEPVHGQTDGYRGHTKGVVIGNGQGEGLWLIHSVPHYPPDLADGSYDYPKTGLLYGQSFLCISFTNETQLELIGQQLIYNNIHVYSSNIPVELQTRYPNLWKASNMEEIKQSPFNNIVKLMSSDNNKFYSFAKSREFDKELYSDWVAPVLNASLYVESWQHGSGNIDTNCNRTHKVYNIDEIKINNLNCEFKSLKDHSKWAIGVEANWVCVGDINRQEHQKKRGGGTVCFVSDDISKIYRDSVATIEPCHK